MPPTRAAAVGTSPRLASALHPSPRGWRGGGQAATCGGQAGPAARAGLPSPPEWRGAGGEVEMLPTASTALDLTPFPLFRIGKGKRRPWLGWLAWREVLAALWRVALEVGPGQRLLPAPPPYRDGGWHRSSGGGLVPGLCVGCTEPRH